MVKIDISSVEQEGDAFWSLLTGLGIEVSEFSVGDDDWEEFEDIERSMETCMPSSNNATRPETEAGYFFKNIKLRSSCVAHLLQLVIKDGLLALQVLSFYKFIEYFVPGF